MITDFDYFKVKIITDLLGYTWWFLAWYLSVKYYFSRNIPKTPLRNLEEKIFYYLWVFGWAMFFAILISTFDNFVNNYGWWDKVYLTKSIAWAICWWVIYSEIFKKIYNHNFNRWVLFVPSLVVWTIIWRIGAFIIWLRDNTHWIPTNLPWWYDYWDHILRHPAQIYEIIILTIFWIIFIFWLKYKKEYFIKKWFFLFTLIYFSYRFLVGFIMPYSNFWLWLNTIQVVSIWMIIYSIYKLKFKVYGK